MAAFPLYYLIKPYMVVNTEVKNFKILSLAAAPGAREVVMMGKREKAEASKQPFFQSYWFFLHSPLRKDEWELDKLLNFSKSF